MRTSIRLTLVALLSVSTIGCDQVTKHLATKLLVDRPTQSLFADTVRLVYSENTGGFLSLGAGLPPVVRSAIFTVATGAILAMLLLTLFRSRWSSWRAVSVALFLGGGVSNWIDRVLRGNVVDFLNVGVGWLRTGIFNVADVAIMLGLAIFLLCELSARSAPHRAAPDA